MKQGTLRSAAVCALIGLSVCAHATTVHVGLGGGYTYNTIQAGIDAAVSGDTVVVHDGIYTGLGNREIDFGGRAITVTSANGAASTIIDCEGAGRGFYFHSGETSTAVVEGFSIRNGQGPTSGTLPSGEAGGGAIYCTGSSPTILGCLFTNNNARHGGAINAQNGSDLTISGCTVSGNEAEYGGGLWSRYCELSITNSLFLGNSASDSGGGLRCDETDTTLTNCLIAGNTAPD